MDIKKVKLIIHKVRKIRSDNLITIHERFANHSHLDVTEIGYQLYLSDNINGKFCYDFDSLNELEQFLKDNLEGYVDTNDPTSYTEQLEAALYEYFENIYDNPLEHDKEIKSYVEDLILVVKSVSYASTEIDK